VTVLEVIQRSTEFLTRKGVDSPRLQTELLLAHLLKLRRLELYLNYQRALSPAELVALRELVQRRGLREPLQLIIGTTEFCGLELAVNRHVLIPRPETELLAELGWSFLNRRAAPEYRVSDANPPTFDTRHSPLSAVDFGTGSGCLAIALAAHCPAARVCALDCSAAALELARQNAARHQFADRIQFFQGDGLAALPAGTQTDLLVSNPPYIPTSEIASLQPEVRDYDPHSALDGGPQGLDFYLRLAAEAKPLLKPGGKIMLEFGDGQELPVAEIFERQNWIVEAIEADYTQRPRILIARQRDSTNDDTNKHR
jgi:release factor glutamine methyltransferase